MVPVMSTATATNHDTDRLGEATATVVAAGASATLCDDHRAVRYWPLSCTGSRHSTKALLARLRDAGFTCTRMRCGTYRVAGTQS